ARRHRQIGSDLVAAATNALAAQGAEPLWLQHALLARHVGSGAVQAVLQGLAEACRGVQCALLDGQTQELMTRAEGTPGFELVAFAVGVCEQSRLIDGHRVRAGDVLVALPARGVHPEAAMAVLVEADAAAAPVQEALLAPL